MESTRVALLVTAVVGVGAAAVACGGYKSSTPTSPTPTPTASVQAVTSPNPVPWSGTPVNLPECVGVANTWLFNTVLTETGGVAVTLTSVVNLIDGGAVPQPPLARNTLIAARGSVTLDRQFCFTQPTQHTIQSTFNFTDASGRPGSVTAPTVTLLARP